jgi:hypothetical protein
MNPNVKLQFKQPREHWLHVADQMDKFGL